MLGFAGVTCNETRVAAVTVAVVLPLTLPLVAEITELPVATDVQRPREPPVLLIVAVPAAALAQVTVAVRSWVELSV